MIRSKSRSVPCTILRFWLCNRMKTPITNGLRLFSQSLAYGERVEMSKDTIFKLDDIPIIKSEPLKPNLESPENQVHIEESGEFNSLRTDFYKTIKDINVKFSNRIDGEYVVLIQVGSFYELYYDQAEKYATLLGLKFSQKQTRSGSIPFSGFPDYALNKYLPIIFDKNLKTVICKQVENTVTGVITRPVDRLITPGTVIDDVLRDYHKNNFIVSLSFPDEYLKDPEGKKIGVAWCDVNLGIFSYVETTFNNLLATLTRIDPSEILISNKVDVDELISGRWFPELVDLKRYFITQYNLPSTKTQFESYLNKFSDNQKLVKSTWDKFTTKEKSASLMLLHYLDFCVPNHKPSFNLPVKDLPKTIMKIDTRAAEDLELIQTIQTRNRVGALTHIMDKTVTNPGARLLNVWLLAPSTNLNEITQRQDLVESLLNNLGFMDDITSNLKATCDVNRILKRIDNNNCNFYEYLELAKTVELLNEISKSLKRHPDAVLIERMDFLLGKFNRSKKIQKLSKDIIKTIDSTLSYRKSDPGKNENEIVRLYWNIQRGSTVELFSLREEYDKLVEEFNLLEAKFVADFKENGYNGSIKFTKDFRTFQYIVELKSQSKSIPEMIKTLDLKVVEKSKSTTKIDSPEWTRIGQNIISLEQRIIVVENEILKGFQTRIQKMYKELRLISPVIEYLDVMQSFTNLALEKNFIKPIVDNSTNFEIKNGRHLVVEEGLRNNYTLNSFTTNDCKVESSKALVITGPNMGGKSTFLRQNALISILSQIGSFVPADYAHIGIIDKIFTRVGSSDNIYKHQSTFMVEMNETAVILREATSKSLVIVDELGRGTSTMEGIAIAYSSLIQLLLKNKSKILFATHFGPELYDLIINNLKVKEDIDFFRTELIKLKVKRGEFRPIDERIKFSHKLYRGVSEYSHALDIADLAGFPKDTLKLAKQTIGALKIK